MSLFVNVRVCVCVCVCVCVRACLRVSIRLFVYTRRYIKMHKRAHLQICANRYCSRMYECMSPKYSYLTIWPLRCKLNVTNTSAVTSSQPADQPTSRPATLLRELLITYVTLAQLTPHSTCHLITEYSSHTNQHTPCQTLAASLDTSASAYGLGSPNSAVIR